MTTATEMRARVLNRAAEDGEFRARLIADPKATIASEVGATIPDGFDVVVHEDSATTAHLVLPPSPKLTEAEMATVAGGGPGLHLVGLTRAKRIFKPETLRKEESHDHGNRTEGPGPDPGPAAEDGDFRASLIADPKAAIASAVGTTLPDSFDVVVHEDSATTAHLVLPPSPKLTDAELEAVAGGAAWMNAVAPRDPATGGKPR